MAPSTLPNTTSASPLPSTFRSRPSDLAADPGLGPGLVMPGSLPEPEPAVPSTRTTQFVAVTGPQAEQISATTILVAAYAIFWVLVFGFVLRTLRGQHALRDRIGILEKKLDGLEAAEPKTKEE